MPGMIPMPSAVAGMNLANRALEAVERCARALDRLLELQETRAHQLEVAGSVVGAGTVGTVPSTCSVTAPLGTSPGTIMKANPHRRGSNVQNLSAAGGPSLTIGLGQQSPAAGVGLVLLPGASWDGRISGELHMGSVTLVASAGGCAFSFLETYGPRGKRNRAV